MSPPGVEVTRYVIPKPTTLLDHETVALVPNSVAEGLVGAVGVLFDFIVNAAVGKPLPAPVTARSMTEYVVLSTRVAPVSLVTVMDSGETSDPFARQVEPPSVEY